jgi:high-affinity iron transporter
VFFLIATVQQDVGIGVPIGAALGILCAFAFGVGMYRGGIKLNLATFFRWTGVFIIFVAAGLLAGAVRAFHEAGLWNLLQETAFDISGILPGDGLVGTLLAGIFGYQDAPTVGEVIVYLAFLLPALSIFYLQGRPHPVPRTA